MRDLDDSSLEIDPLESEAEAADERWLISYADMMTLLFGLFVMLYAMSNPDQVRPKDADLIKTSLRDNFGAPSSTPVSNPTKEIPSGPSRKEDGDSGTAPGERPGRVDVKNDDPHDGNDPNSDHKARMEVGSSPAIAAAPALAPAPVESDTSDEPDPELIESLQNAKSRVRALNKQMGVMKASLKDKDAEYAKLQKRLASVEAELNSQKEQSKGKSGGPLKGDGENKRSFISTFLQWETEKHDVDMIIVHPSGKKFSYKNRTYPDMTGNFILDSRQGPGMEVWQDASLTPGRYELHAKLYNDYGNHKPAVVRGSILTVKGRLDLPKVELTMRKHPEEVYIFTVDPEGGITLESK